MSKDEYKLIWKEGSFFEKGHWNIVKNNSDSFGNSIVLYFLILILIVFLGMLAIMTIPILCALIGFQMTRENRYIVGIISIIGFVYFHIDMSNEWISSILFHGWTSDEGKFTEGLLGFDSYKFFLIINYIGLGLGLGYIIDAILISNYGKKFNDSRITLPQVLVYVTPIFFMFILSLFVRFNNGFCFSNIDFENNRKNNYYNTNMSGINSNNNKIESEFNGFTYDNLGKNDSSLDIETIIYNESNLNFEIDESYFPQINGLEDLEFQTYINKILKLYFMNFIDSLKIETNNASKEEIEMGLGYAYGRFEILYNKNNILSIRQENILESKYGGNSAEVFNNVYNFNLKEKSLINNNDFVVDCNSINKKIKNYLDKLFPENISEYPEKINCNNYFSKLQFGIEKDSLIIIVYFRGESRANEGFYKIPLEKFKLKQKIKIKNQNKYKAVKIGVQEWMVENLNVDRFCNGDPIPEARTDEDWNVAEIKKQPAWCYYNNNSDNGLRYGKLYNWYAVNDSRGLAPEGWYLPSDADWTILENYLADNGYNYDGTLGGGGNKIAKSMACENYWNNSTNKGAVGNTDYIEYRNKSGFTAIPGGIRSAGKFNGMGYHSYWWSSSEEGKYSAWCRYLGGIYRDFSRNDLNRGDGLSVRCLRKNK